MHTRGSVPGKTATIVRERGLKAAYDDVNAYARGDGPGLVTVIPSLHGQDRGRYRDYRLGASLASVSALTGVAATDAKAIHERPAVRQELQWRRPYVPSTPPVPIDPAKEIVFSFYDDQLTRMVVDDDPDQTAGMTDADLTEAISTQDGPVSKPGAKASHAVPSQLETESELSLRDGATRTSPWHCSGRCTHRAFGSS